MDFGNPSGSRDQYKSSGDPAFNSLPNNSGLNPPFINPNLNRFGNLNRDGTVGVWHSPEWDSEDHDVRSQGERSYGEASQRSWQTNSSLMYPTYYTMNYDETPALSKCAINREQPSINKSAPANRDSVQLDLSRTFGEQTTKSGFPRAQGVTHGGVAKTSPEQGSLAAAFGPPVSVPPGLETLPDSFAGTGGFKKKTDSADNTTGSAKTTNMNSSTTNRTDDSMMNSGLNSTNSATGHSVNNNNLLPDGKNNDGGLTSPPQRAVERGLDKGYDYNPTSNSQENRRQDVYRNARDDRQMYDNRNGDSGRYGDPRDRRLDSPQDPQQRRYDDRRYDRDPWYDRDPRYDRDPGYDRDLRYEDRRYDDRRYDRDQGYGWDPRYERDPEYDRDLRYEDRRYEDRRYDRDPRYDDRRYDRDPRYDRNPRYEDRRYDRDPGYNRDPRYDDRQYDRDPRYDDRRYAELRYDDRRYDDPRYDRYRYDEDRNDARVPYDEYHGEKGPPPTEMGKGQRPTGKTPSSTGTGNEPTGTGAGNAGTASNSERNPLNTEENPSNTNGNSSNTTEDSKPMQDTIARLLNQNDAQLQNAAQTASANANPRAGVQATSPSAENLTGGESKGANEGNTKETRKPEENLTNILSAILTCMSDKNVSIDTNYASFQSEIVEVRDRETGIEGQTGLQTASKEVLKGSKEALQGFRDSTLGAPNEGQGDSNHSASEAEQARPNQNGTTLLAASSVNQVPSSTGVPKKPEDIIGNHSDASQRDLRIEEYGRKGHYDERGYFITDSYDSKRNGDYDGTYDRNYDRNWVRGYDRGYDRDNVYRDDSRTLGTMPVDSREPRHDAIRNYDSRNQRPYGSDPRDKDYAGKNKGDESRKGDEGIGNYSYDKGTGKYPCDKGYDARPSEKGYEKNTSDYGAKTSDRGGEQSHSGSQNGTQDLHAAEQYYRDPERYDYERYDRERYDRERYDRGRYEENRERYESERKRYESERKGYETHGDNYGRHPSDKYHEHGYDTRYPLTGEPKPIAALNLKCDTVFQKGETFLEQNSQRSNDRDKGDNGSYRCDKGDESSGSNSPNNNSARSATSGSQKRGHSERGYASRYGSSGVSQSRSKSSRRKQGHQKKGHEKVGSVAGSEAGSAHSHSQPRDAQSLHSQQRGYNADAPYKRDVDTYSQKSGKSGQQSSHGSHTKGYDHGFGGGYGSGAPGYPFERGYGGPVQGTYGIAPAQGGASGSRAGSNAGSHSGSQVGGTQVGLSGLSPAPAATIEYDQQYALGNYGYYRIETPGIAYHEAVGKGGKIGSNLSDPSYAACAAPPGLELEPPAQGTYDGQPGTASVQHPKVSSISRLMITPQQEAILRQQEIYIKQQLDMQLSADHDVTIREDQEYQPEVKVKPLQVDAPIGGGKYDDDRYTQSSHTSDNPQNNRPLYTQSCDGRIPLTQKVSQKPQRYDRHNDENRDHPRDGNYYGRDPHSRDYDGRANDYARDDYQRDSNYHDRDGMGYESDAPRRTSSTRRGSVVDGIPCGSLAHGAQSYAGHEHNHAPYNPSYNPSQASSGGYEDELRAGSYDPRGYPGGASDIRSQGTYDSKGHPPSYDSRQAAYDSRHDRHAGPSKGYIGGADHRGGGDHRGTTQNVYRPPSHPPSEPHSDLHIAQSNLHRTQSDQDRGTMPVRQSTSSTHSASARSAQEYAASYAGHEHGPFDAASYDGYGYARSHDGHYHERGLQRYGQAGNARSYSEQDFELYRDRHYDGNYPRGIYNRDSRDQSLSQRHASWDDQNRMVYHRVDSHSSCAHSEYYDDQRSNYDSAPPSAPSGTAGANFSVPSSGAGKGDLRKGPSKGDLRDHNPRAAANQRISQHSSQRGHHEGGSAYDGSVHSISSVAVSRNSRMAQSDITPAGPERTFADPLRGLERTYSGPVGYEKYTERERSYDKQYSDSNRYGDGRGSNSGTSYDDGNRYGDARKYDHQAGYGMRQQSNGYESHRSGGYDVSWQDVSNHDKQRGYNPGSGQQGFNNTSGAQQGYNANAGFDRQKYDRQENYHGRQNSPGGIPKNYQAQNYPCGLHNDRDNDNDYQRDQDRKKPKQDNRQNPNRSEGDKPTSKQQPGPEWTEGLCSVMIRNLPSRLGGLSLLNFLFSNTVVEEEFQMELVDGAKKNPPASTNGKDVSKSGTPSDGNQETPSLASLVSVSSPLNNGDTTEKDTEKGTEKGDTSEDPKEEDASLATNAADNATTNAAHGPPKSPEPRESLVTKIVVAKDFGPSFEVPDRFWALLLRHLEGADRPLKSMPPEVTAAPGEGGVSEDDVLHGFWNSFQSPIRIVSAYLAPHAACLLTFFNLPTTTNSTNFGYCFATFKTPDFALRFKGLMEGKRVSNSSTKRLEIVPARINMDDGCQLRLNKSHAFWFHADGQVTAEGEIHWSAKKKGKKKKNQGLEDPEA